MSKEHQVLFLDDEESIIDGIQRLFAREAYGVLGTTSVSKARETLAQGTIKVVVSDQRMPEISGAKFLKEVKESYPDIVRILFTGYTDFSSAEEAINQGEVYRFISKPWKTTELLSTIRQAIEHHDLIITARKKTEETELANKKLKALYEVQREFTSTVSHELRTPLASIKTAIDLVTKGITGAINEEQGEVLGRAKKNVDRLKRLIDDILDLTKIESGKMNMDFQMNDVNVLIKEVLENQKDVAQSRGLYLKEQLDPNLPKIPFDHDRIIQVINNLLSNAFKFTKEGGVTVVTEDKSPENHIVVRVVDTGKGIAEEDVPKLFQKFQQIESGHENEEGGTGLGLAICKEIIVRHGGKIWVESAPAKGASFCFVLPLQERRAGV